MHTCTRTERIALLAEFINRLSLADIRTTENAVSLGCYLAQELLAIPWGYHFALYRRCPYSRDLRADLVVAEELRVLVRIPVGLGPSCLTVTDTGRVFARRHVVLSGEQKASLQKVVDVMVEHSLVHLRRVATALYVDRIHPNVSDHEIIADLGGWLQKGDPEEVYQALLALREEIVQPAY